MDRKYEKPKLSKIMDLLTLSKKVKAGSTLNHDQPPVGCGSIGIDTEAV